MVTWEPSENSVIRSREKTTMLNAANGSNTVEPRIDLWNELHGSHF